MGLGIKVCLSVSPIGEDGIYLIYMYSTMWGAGIGC